LSPSPSRHSRCPLNIHPAGRPIPRDGAIIFSDLIGKLDALEVACDKCGRKGRYAVVRLHFEIRKGSAPLDPMPFLNKGG
jgi:hypothetical protein